MNNRKPLDAAFEKIANSKKVNLESQKVELGLVDDIEKILDKANGERRRLQTQALKIAEAFNNLQSDYTRAFMMSKDAENKAKELGADDLRKLFGNRGDEASDYQNQVGKAANKIKSIINAI